MGEVLVVLLQLLRVLATNDREVADLLQGLVTGEPEARQRIAEILPPAWAARAVEAAIERDRAPRMVAPDPPPRYDALFAESMAAVDAEEGVGVQDHESARASTEPPPPPVER